MAALRDNRFDVYVPRAIGPTWAGMNVVPRRAREALARAMNFDRALRDADHAARAAYEARAAASAPAADAVIAESAGRAGGARAGRCLTPRQGPSRASSGSSAAASRDTVMWIASGSRTHAIALSTCSRSSTNWKASAWRPDRYERAMSNAQPVVWSE